MNDAGNVPEPQSDALRKFSFSQNTIFEKMLQCSHVLGCLVKLVKFSNFFALTF